MVESFFAAHGLDICRGVDALDVFYCMYGLPEETILRRVAAVYALYRLYNGCRHGTFQPSDFIGAFSHYYGEAST